MPRRINVPCSRCQRITGERFDGLCIWCREKVRRDPRLAVPKTTVGTDDSIAIADTPILSVYDGQMIQLEKPELLQPLPSPKHPNAMVVIAADKKSQTELAISKPSLVRYAERCGMDYVELTRLSKSPHPCGHKYAVSHVAPLYERILLVDCDILIRDHAPSILDATPDDHWGMVDDLSKLKSSPYGENWIIDEWDEQADALGLHRVPLTSVWNSGVVVIPCEDIDSYAPPPAPVPNRWCAEQHFHTRSLVDRQAKVMSLPDCWNLGWPWSDWPAKLPSAYFVHINGCPYRLRLRFMTHLSDGTSTIPAELKAEAAKVEWCRWAREV